MCDDGMKEMRSKSAGDPMRLLRTLPRNHMVRTSTRICTLGMLLNLALIVLRVILYFWTKYMLRPIIRLTWHVMNLSNLSRRSFRRAQDSKLHKRRLIGMAIKMRYFEYVLT
jgi:hypothetical protein